MNPLIIIKKTTLLGVAVGLGAVVPGQAMSEAVIDAELATQVDFRTDAFSTCAQRPTCTVNGITLTAERRKTLQSPWEPAELYWGPVDGLGVLDGAQNDEIDFDERLIVEFDTTTLVDGIWLSDLFQLEDGRYGSGQTLRVEGQPEDAEIAGISLLISDIEVSTLLISGQDALPIDPFNELVSEIYTEDGDLERRILIDQEVVTIVVPDPQDPTVDLVLTVPIGQIDKEKLVIFEGVETIDVDIDELLGEFNRTPIFVEGTTNFERLQAAMINMDQMSAIRASAAAQRVAGDRSNGEYRISLADELGEDAADLARLDGVVFFAPFDASNDFSVAGIVLGDGEAVQ